MFRWLCIVAVVVQHSVFTQRQTSGFHDSLMVAKEAGGWCVVGFFFLSGWLSRPESFGPKAVVGRFHRLLVPFLCVNLAVGSTMYVLVHFLSIRLNSGEVWTLDAMFFRVLFLQGFGPQLYFLPYLFFIWLIAGTSFKFLGRTAALALWVGVAGFFFARNGLPAAAYGSESDRLPLYFLSIALGMAFSDGTRNPVRIVLASGAALAGLGLALTGHGLSLLHVFASVGLFLAAKALIPGHAFPWATRWSAGAVFLWHAPFVHPASSILWYRLLGPQDGWISFCLTMATTIAACLAIDKLILQARLGRWLSL